MQKNETQELLSQLTKSGMTKWKISKELHISWNTVRLWERGIFNPRPEKLEVLKKLANLGMTNG